MDRLERNGDATSAMLAAFTGLKSEMWSALPGIVQSFDAGKGTVVVQPAIQALWRDPLGNETWQTMPLCLDVPVVFPSGGGCTITFPLKEGDECLLVFASRCIDAWWQSGGVAVQAELRMHDLSDGFCIPGPRSQPRKLSGVSSSALQIRADDGSAYVELGATAPHAVKVLTAGSVDIEAPTINLKGAVNVTGAMVVTGNISAPNIITPSMPSGLNTHRHEVPFPPGGQTGFPHS